MTPTQRANTIVIDKAFEWSWPGYSDTDVRLNPDRLRKLIRDAIADAEAVEHYRLIDLMAATRDFVGYGESMALSLMADDAPVMFTVGQLRELRAAVRKAECPASASEPGASPASQSSIESERTQSKAPE